MALLHNKYQVAEGDSLDELRKNVTALLEAGFVPCGGIAHYVIEVNDGKWDHFIQAMWEPVWPNPQRVAAAVALAPS